MPKQLFTSESVSMGHPDKIADQISDAVLDAYLAQDRNSRVACETLVTTGLVVVSGEITSRGRVDFQSLVRDTVRRIGYTDSSMGFDYRSCAVLVAVDKQSPDISQGVTRGQGLHKEQGAGDQGMMFGYACDETPERMPLPIFLAHRLIERLTGLRQQGRLKYLRPDAKSQVTVAYDDDRPAWVDTVVISTQHAESAPYAVIRKDMIEKVIKPIIPARYLRKSTRFLINPTGRFVVGGPMGDCGLTGRKIIVDTYGGMGRHGGGAFSGKDPSKVDRSAAYAARYAAKNLVAAGLARRLEVQLAYAIGYPEPVSVRVDTFGTGRADDDRLAALVQKHFNLTPGGIVRHLKLLRPVFTPTAYHGHFGRRGSGFTWEKVDKAAILKKEAAKWN